MNGTGSTNALGPTRRERLRSEMTDDIKRLAVESLARDGAASLSLRDIARSLGVSPSALYRYFASRDALLDALIAEAFVDVAERIEAAIITRHGSHPMEAWRQAALAARGWALSEPHRWTLIFGSVVPGYNADASVTRAPALRITSALTELLIDAVDRDFVDQDAVDRAARLIPRSLGADVRQLMKARGWSVPVPLMLQGIAAWSQLVGVITFEILGHLDHVIDDRESLFAYQVTKIGASISWIL